MGSPLDKTVLSVVIAANNEEHHIGPCLQSLLGQDDGAGRVEVVVAANGCSDRTVERARAHEAAFQDKDWRLIVIDLPDAGKLNAITRGEQAASGDILVYLDADVRCDAPLLGQLRVELSGVAPRYATGTLQVAPAKSWVTRRYAHFWTQLPFVQDGAVGAGLFAVNRAGRARWDTFPSIISDDTFARLQFRPAERVEVPARYHWPMVEGYSNLVRVRKRQDEGVLEVFEQFPDLRENEGKRRLSRSGLLALLARDPIGFCVYGLVHLSVRMRRQNRDWVRGR